MIPYGRQSLDQGDLDAVLDVLRSDWLTQGPAVPRFEAALATHCGAAHAVAVNSATAALHIACLALGVGPGDRVWTSPNTFVASANCARYCGAEVDFVDIDPDTGNMSVVALADKLGQAKLSGHLPKVVIPVHFAGHACDMAAIAELARTYGFAVIEDASHAVGARQDGLPVGNCRWSDITVFSFHPVKIVTTGEGGAALTNSPHLANRLARLRSHGITRDPAEMENASAAPWYYEQIELGFNYRLTDIQAALGASQMGRLEAFVARRRAIAAAYGRALAGTELALPVERPGVQSSWHLYVVRTPRRDELFARLRQSDIGVQVHYIPVHCQPYYRRLGFGPGQFPNAEAHGAQALSLPMFPALTDDHVARVVDAVHTALRVSR
ncbi:MAG: UDP-4-amino-4,6-dideoxy-N-acetyl-beta-L-altrosamine transaminase [Bacteroidota bacterium]